jgi:hypothetical protein
VVRHERLGRCDAELLREHRCERLHLHLAEPGERLEPPAQVVRVGGVAPDPRRVAAVLVRDDRRDLLDALRHAPREPVEGRPLAEDLHEPLGLERRQLRGVEAAEPALEVERAVERLLHRHLLVEHEADQERQRVAGEQGVRLGVTGEVERVGHGSILSSPGIPAS